MWGWAHALARRERECLAERCRAPQNGDMPLHRAATNGHAAIVEQLLAAGAVTHAKSKVRRREMRDADRAGSRDDTRRVEASLFSGFSWFPQQVLFQVRIFVFGEGTNLTSEWIT